MFRPGFLPRLVGTGMAAEFAYAGDVMDAERALAIGLVNRVVDPDDLLPESIGLAASIAKKPRAALEATKQALRTSWHTDLAGSPVASFWTVAALPFTDDFKEGVNAAFGWRPRRFNGG